MSIVAQCQACKAKYNVPDTMAGKKVRCKKCGQIFGVPAPETEIDLLPDEPDLSGVDDENDAPAARPILAKSAVRPAPRRPSVLPPVSSMRGEVDTGEDESSDESGDTDLAANPAFAFPGNAFIEGALPYLIVAVAVVWMVSSTLRVEDFGRSWVGHLRWFVYLLAYVVIVYPITMLGVRTAGENLRFGLPPAHAWKVFSLFSLPFMLGVIWSLTGVGPIGTYTAGIVVGLIIALAGFLFLYRLRPNQMVAGLGIITAFFVSGCALAALLGFGINIVLVSAMKPTETVGAIPRSPLGPAFPWPQPPLEKRNTVTKGNPTTEDTSPETPVTKGAGDPVIVPETPGKGSTAPGTVDAGDPKMIKPKDPTDPNPLVASTDPEKKMPTEPGVNPLDPTIVPVIPVKPAPVIVSPMLAAAPVNSPIGEFDDIFYSALAGPPVALVVRERGPISDTLEVWNTQPFEKKGTLSPPHPLNEHPIYWVGPRGLIFARLIDFPKKLIEIRLTAEDKVIRTIELDTERLGIPEIIGFAGKNQIAILWDLGQRHGVELFDTTTGQRMRTIDLPGFQKSKGNIAFSPDGRYFAAAVKSFLPGGLGTGVSTPAIQLSDVAIGQLAPRPYPITVLGGDKNLTLSGLAFSPDSQKFSMLYEEAGNNLIVTWKPPETRAFLQYNFFSDHSTGATTEYHGAAIEALPGAATWLIYGHSVVETDHVIGDLGVTEVKGHRRLSNDTFALKVPSESGKMKLMIVTLNAEKFPGKEATKPTGKPKL